MKKKPFKTIDPVVLIKPKDKNQDSEITKNDLKNKLDPKDILANGLRNVRDGGIVVRCKNKESTEKIKEVFDKDYQEKYETSIPESKKPRIKIVGVNDPPKENSEIIDILKKQNPEIFDDFNEIQIVAVINIKRKNSNYSNIIVQVNGRTYNKIMNSKNASISFMWQKCKVYDAVYVKRCFKCCEFSNHDAKDCSKDLVCFKCAGNHKSEECTEEVEKCINCVRYNERLRLNLDINHNAMSSECPVFKRIINNRKRNINYNE